MSLEVPAIPVLSDAPQAVDDSCSPFDRIAIVLGGAALGAGIGFAITMTVGVLEPARSALYGTPIYLVALYLAYGGWRDEADLGTLRAIPPAFLLAAVAVWPVTVLLSPGSAPPLWPLTVLGLSAVCVLTESSRSHSVFRSSWLIVFTTILAANQAMQALVGA